MEKTEQLKSILTDLDNRELTKHQAHDLIRVLFSVSGSLPTLEEIDKEAEGRYPVNTHSNPNDTPYKGSKKTFIHGVNWALNYTTNYR